MTAINEFRVRPVARYQLTHFHASGKSQGVRTVGEFDSVESAEEVGVALQALVPGSTLTTISGRSAENPPRALASSMPNPKTQIGDVIDVIVNANGDVAEMRVYAVHEWDDGRRLLDCTHADGVFISGRGTGSVLDAKPFELLNLGKGMAIEMVADPLA